MDDLKSKSSNALLWDLFAKLARHGTGFIVTVVLARLLEPSDFGVIAMAMVVIGIAFIFTDIGLGSALIQRRRVLPIHYSSVFYFNIFIGLLLSLATFLSSRWISDFYENPQLLPVIQIVSSLFVINAFSSVQVSKLRKKLNYAVLAKADVGAAVLSGVLGIALALYGAGVWSLVAQAVSRGVFYNIILWYTSKWVPSLTFSIKALRQLWGFGFRMFLSGLLETVYTRLDIIIIGKLFSPAVLGFYDQAKRLQSLIVIYSSGSLISILFPVLSKLQYDFERFNRVVIKTLGIICFVIFFLLGIMYLISDELIVLLFTEKWLPIVEYFKILLLSGFAYPVSALLVNILSSKGNSKAFLRLEIYKKILASMNFGIGFIWGIEGYLYGLVIVSIAGVFLNIIYAKREIDLSLNVFIRPIFVQASITVFIVVLINMTTQEWSMSHIMSLISKGLLFFLLYFFLNKILMTESYCSFAEQLYPKLKQIMKIKWRR